MLIVQCPKEAKPRDRYLIRVDFFHLGPNSTQEHLAIMEEARKDIRVPCKADRSLSKLRCRSK
jgi:hypothetical protein